MRCALDLCVVFLCFVCVVLFFFLFFVCFFTINFFSSIFILFLLLGYYLQPNSKMLQAEQAGVYI